mmetsp:Transcript_105560/g.279845  ORF Transcript_105560/g.279845 Transcript_105560/m.279845 type:complete len:585 (+) Transcript_105560:3-1757(+)
MSSWPQSSCPEETWAYNNFAWFWCWVVQWSVFLWNVHLVYQRIVKLEQASIRDLGSKFLRWIIRASVILQVCAALIDMVAFITMGHDLEGVHIVLGVGFLLMVLFSLAAGGRAFWLALKLAEAEAEESHLDAAEHDIACYAVRVARKHLVGVTVSMAAALPVAMVVIAMSCLSAAEVNYGVHLTLGLHVTLMLNTICNIVSVAELSGLLDSSDILHLRGGRILKPPRGVQCLDGWSTGNPAWDAEVKKIAKRGFTLNALLKFYASLGKPDGPMPHYDPKVHTTNDVARQAIIPLSRGTKFGDCAMATVMMHGKETLPSKLVTHTWQNLFAHLVAAIVADALRIPMYEHILYRLAPGELSTLVSELYWKGKLKSTYWVCVFSVNQHASTCHLSCGDDPVTGSPHPTCGCATEKHDTAGLARLADGRLICSEINKFDDMMDCLATSLPPGGFAQCIAVDAEFELFQRAWCIAEIHRASTMGLHQSMELLSELCWSRHRSELENLRVEDMKATNSNDKVAILAKIPDKEAFNAELNRMVFDEKGLMRNWQDGLDIVCMLGKVLKMSAASQMEPRKSRAPVTLQCTYS